MIVTEIAENVIALPSQLRGVDDVFRFSFDELEYILNEFSQTKDIKIRLLELVDFVEENQEIGELKQIVSELLQSELDIIDFSKQSRSSVIQF